MKYLLVGTLKGSLGAIKGVMNIDGDNPHRSTVTASIDVAALNTGIRLRDVHLRSGDFFDVERFPQVTFRSTRVERVDGTTFRVVGDLTIRDITKEVALNATYEERPGGETGSRRARLTAVTVLSRREFGLGTRTPIESAGLIASDRVNVTLDISADSAEPVPSSV